MEHKLLLTGGIIVTARDEFRADLALVGEKISAVADRGELDANGFDRVLDCTGCYIVPGFLDSHTHMALPVSKTVSSDDFFSGGRGAAFGGVTTVIDFTVPRTGSSLIEDVKRRKETAKISPVDFSFHGTCYGFSGTGMERQIRKAIDEGVTSFKFFTAYEESGRRTDYGQLYDAFRTIGRHGGLCVVHCEHDEIVKFCGEELRSVGNIDLSYHPRSRPDFAEASAISTVIHLSEQTGTPVHIAHVSSEKGLASALRWEGSGSVTVETCPQYLLLTEKCYEKEKGFLYSVTPPLRNESDRRALWDGVSSGSITTLATDHCPFTTEQKVPYKDDFVQIPQGLPGVETMVPLLFSAGVNGKKISLSRMVELTSTNPARLFGLYPQKGSLEVGTDGDVAVLDPERSVKLSAENLHMNTDFSPYEGMEVKGFPRYVLLRGEVIVEENKFKGEEGGGKWLRRD